MSSTSASGFKWLDFLEKEFDKSFVSIDHSARSISDEYELEEVYDTQRKLLSNLGNCFVQLVHKSQTIFQVNAKLEAELINAKENLANYHKSVTKIEAEKSYLLCLLQSCLLENSLLKSKDPNVEHEKLAENVQLKLANDLAALQRVDWARFFTSYPDFFIHGYFLILELFTLLTQILLQISVKCRLQYIRSFLCYETSSGPWTSTTIY